MHTQVYFFFAVNINIETAIKKKMEIVNHFTPCIDRYICSGRKYWENIAINEINKNKPPKIYDEIFIDLTNLFSQIYPTAIYPIIYAKNI